MLKLLMCRVLVVLTITTNALLVSALTRGDVGYNTQCDMISMFITSPSFTIHPSHTMFVT